MTGFFMTGLSGAQNSFPVRRADSFPRAQYGRVDIIERANHP
jgi:hypothetical protein